MNDTNLDEQIRIVLKNYDQFITTKQAISDIKALIATQIQEARINELENLLADDGQCICQLANQEACDHNWSLCNTVKDRIAQLRSTK